MNESQENLHSAQGPLPTLCEADGHALDALLASRAEGLALPESVDSQRAAAVDRVLRIMDNHPEDEPPADLVQRTLAGVNAARRQTVADRQAAAMADDRPAAGSFAIFGRWAEIGVAAAMILVGFSLMLPSLQHGQAESRRNACTANLAGAGLGFQSWANDHDQKLPSTAEAKPKGVWIRVGQPQSNGQVQSNSAQYYLLVRRGYVNPHDLSCPENEFAPQDLSPDAVDFPNPQAPSYSYQNQYSPFIVRMQVGSPNANMAVLADRNPLFHVNEQGQLAFDPTVDVNSNSRLHSGKGQNVLLNNLSVKWLETPELPKVNRETGEEHVDNIWTAEGVDHYTGTESPQSPIDSHLVP